ncbi:CvpA family protein [Alkaliphilus transvaalensis]|uniref:CvpA family protein n=1 Tax=Alkaliphilus transvaalensis TaxID=114628 RepID=UPI00047D3753|nr:CvpA family protein [Alkaliphilus transvaalensis]
MTVIDMIIIGCVVINVAMGYKKGLIWTIIGLSSYLIAGFSSKIFYKDLSLWIQNYTDVFNKLENFIDNNFYSIFQGSTLNPATGEMPFEGMGVLSNFLLKNADVQSYAHNTVELIKTEIVEGVATLLLNLISIIIIFIVVKAIVLIIGKVLEQIFKLPVLNSFNKTGGIIIGALKGVILSIMILMVLFVFSAISPEGLIATSIEKSIILQFFSGGNFTPLLNWLL